MARLTPVNQSRWFRSGPWRSQPSGRTHPSCFGGWALRTVLAFFSGGVGGGERRASTMCGPTQPGWCWLPLWWVRHSRHLGPHQCRTPRLFAGVRGGAALPETGGAILQSHRHNWGFMHLWWRGQMTCLETLNDLRDIIQHSAFKNFVHCMDKEEDALCWGKDVCYKFLWVFQSYRFNWVLLVG